MKTALIVSGGGFQGLGLVRALQQSNDTRVVVCDVFSENVTRYVCSDYVVAPPLDQEEVFTQFLIELVKREKISDIFPATARELAILSRLKESLRQMGAAVAVSEQRLLATLLDKQKAYEWLHVRNLPVLPIIDPQRFDFAEELFGRPREGWGGRGTIVIGCTRDVVALGEDVCKYLWTRRLAEFQEYSADFAIAGQGRISTIVLRQRVRTSGGFAVISVSIFDRVLEKLILDLAGVLAAEGGDGLFNVQVLIPERGSPVISDINPRVGTSATHSLAEGVNLPKFFMQKSAAEARSTIERPRKNVRTIRLLSDLSIPRFERPGGIVFDLDDTLVDHKLWMYQKIEAVYQAVFFQHSGRDVFLTAAAQLIDEGVRADLIDRLLKELKLTPDLRENAIEAYRAAIVPDTPLFPDVAATLQALKAAGFPLAILTDNPPATQKAKIEHAPTLNCFDAVVYARQCGAEKPDAHGFLRVSQALCIAPESLVMIGDNYFRDGIGAVRAGYAHALIVRREGGFLNHHWGLMSKLDEACFARIHVVDSLLSAFHACAAP
jgi:FMN phosphatase YigB (HAD superfamily)/carbamoylphosphate synthase large subunit